MDNPIEIPVKGAPLRVQWGAGVANRLNSIGSFCPSGMLLSDGATGTGFSPLPKNLRDRRQQTRPRQCWDYVPPIYDLEAGEIVEPGYFYEPYVYVGTKLYRYAGEFGRDGLDDGFVYATVNLSGTSPTINVGSATTVEGVQRQTSEAGAFATILLYQFVDEKITCDFRAIPTIPAWEFGQ